jgi:hypothetical protein
MWAPLVLVHRDAGAGLGWLGSKNIGNCLDKKPSSRRPFTMSDPRSPTRLKILPQGRELPGLRFRRNLLVSATFVSELFER